MVISFDSEIALIETRERSRNSDPVTTFSTVSFARSATSMILFSMLCERVVEFSIVETISLIPVDCSTEVDSVALHIFLRSVIDEPMTFPSSRVRSKIDWNRRMLWLIK